MALRKDCRAGGCHDTLNQLQIGFTIGGFMELSIVINDITEIAADAIIVNLFEGVKNPGGATAKVDTALDGAITSLI